GRLVQEGRPDDLILEPATAFVAEFTGADLLLDGELESADGEMVVVRLPGGARVRGRVAGDPPAVGDRVHASYRPEDVVIALLADRGTTSAVNRFSETVGSVTPSGALVRLRL